MLTTTLTTSADPVFSRKKLLRFEQQEADVQVLRRHDVKDDGDGDDRHHRGGHLPEIGAEDDGGEMRRHHREADAGRQHQREQEFKAFVEMNANGVATLVGVNLHGEREEGGRRADRRNDQRLANEVGAGGILPGCARPDEAGNDEAVDHGRQRQQRQRDGQRQPGLGQAEQPGAVETDNGPAPGFAAKGPGSQTVSQRRRHQQQPAGASQEGDGDAEHRNHDGAQDRRLHGREGLQSRPQQVLAGLEQSDRQRQTGGGQGRPVVKTGRERAEIDERRQQT